MSAVIQTATPFIEAQLLIEALETLGAEPQLYSDDAKNTTLQNYRGTQLVAGDILTNRSDYYGPQFFRLSNNTYSLFHDSSEMQVVGNRRDYQKIRDFLANLDKAYRNAWNQRQERLAEEARIKAEEMRKKKVEEVRQAVIEKARMEGYYVEEEIVNDNVQLILSRTVY